MELEQSAWDGDVITAEEKVFGNEMLLDMILRWAIVEPEPDGTDDNTANACRLVQHHWLERVNVILRLAERPIELNGYVQPNSRSEEDVGRFLNAFEDAPVEHIPPFMLCMGPITYRGIPFDLNFLQSCVSCLSRCGTSLVGTYLSFVSSEWHITAEPSSLPAITTPLSLPYLDSVQTYLDFDFCSEACIFWVAKLFQAILDGSERLREVCFLYETRASKKLPLCFENLKLPSTLSTVLFDKDMRITEVQQLLFGSPLTNLSTLILEISWGKDYDAKDELFRILERFRKQLKVLKIKDAYDDYDEAPLRNPRPPATTTIVVPVMEKLEVLVFKSCNFQWPEKVPSKPNIYFPAVRNLSLRYQPFQMFRKWFATVKGTSVEKLSVELEAKKPTGGHDDWILLQQMHYLKQCFPKLKILKLSIPVTPAMSSVKFIWEEMKELRELKVEIYYNCHPRMHPQFFNALLTGISWEELSDLQSGPDNWRDKKLNFGELSSIVNLTELKKLELVTRSTCLRDGEWNADLAFELAFFQMPQLRKITLSGLKASLGILTRWNEQERVLLLDED